MARGAAMAPEQSTRTVGKPSAAGTVFPLAIPATVWSAYAQASFLAACFTGSVAPLD
jgi:hypothetical protein